MTWAEQWSYKIDGTEINDLVNYFTQVPELSNMPEKDVILAQVDGDYPVYIRTQPQEASYTFLIAMKVDNNVDFDNKLNVIKTLFSDGPHTFRVQARGMSTARTMTVIPKGMMIEFKNRTITVSTVSPKPVLV